MAKVIADIQGIRDIKEHSAFKDYAAANPDWAESPEGVEKAVAIAPSLAYQGATLGQQLYNQRMQRAGSRLIFQNTGDQSAHRAYASHLEQNPNDYAGAEDAANGVWQRYLDAAELQYGPEFAANLKRMAATWDLNGYSQRQPIYNQLLGAMRQQVPVTLTDPNTGEKINRTVSLLPGQETQQWLDDNAAFKPILGKPGEKPPQALNRVPEDQLPPGTPKGAVLMRDAATGQESWAVTPEQAAFPATAMQDEAKTYLSNENIKMYPLVEQAWQRGRKAATEASIGSDRELAMALAQASFPGNAVVATGTLDQVMQQGLFNQIGQGWINTALGKDGMFTATQRRTAVRLLDNAFNAIREQAAQVRKQTAEKETMRGWPAGAITGFSPWAEDADINRIKALPIDPGEGGGGGAGGGEGAGTGNGKVNFDNLTLQELRDWGQQHRDPKTGRIRFGNPQQKTAWDNAMQFQLSRGQGTPGAAPAGGP